MLVVSVVPLALPPVAVFVLLVVPRVPCMLVGRRLNPAIFHAGDLLAMPVVPYVPLVPLPFAAFVLLVVPFVPFVFGRRRLHPACFYSGKVNPVAKLKYN